MSHVTIIFLGDMDFSDSDMSNLRNDHVAMSILGVKGHLICFHDLTCAGHMCLSQPGPWSDNSSPGCTTTFATCHLQVAPSPTLWQHLSSFVAVM